MSRLLLVSPGPVAASFWPERRRAVDAARTEAERARLQELWAGLEHAPDNALPRPLSSKDVRSLMSREDGCPGE